MEKHNLLLFVSHSWISKNYGSSQPSCQKTEIIWDSQCTQALSKSAGVRTNLLDVATSDSLFLLFTSSPTSCSLVPLLPFSTTIRGGYPLRYLPRDDFPSQYGAIVGLASPSVPRPYCYASSSLNTHTQLTILKPYLFSNCTANCKTVKGQTANLKVLPSQGESRESSREGLAKAYCDTLLAHPWRC